jgi:hypothetical protein
VPGRRLRRAPGQVKGQIPHRQGQRTHLAKAAGTAALAETPRFIHISQALGSAWRGEPAVGTGHAEKKVLARQPHADGKFLQPRPQEISMSKSTLSRLGVVAALSLCALAAQAADVTVKCEKRSNRSSVSVDGNNLVSGSYRAVAQSGKATATSGYDTTVGDEVEFDFDSAANDIAAGDTAIPAGFIVDGRVKGYLVNTAGQRVTPVVTATCRVRK